MTIPPELSAGAAASLPTHRRKSASAPILVIAGLVLVVGALVPSAMRWLDEQFGMTRLLAIAVGVLCWFAAWLSRELFALRARFLDLMEDVLKIFYGPNFRRDREAVDILVRAMNSPQTDVKKTAREHLVRLTGADQGDDAARWESWWTEKRATFRSPGAPEVPRRSFDGDA